MRKTGFTLLHIVITSVITVDNNDKCMNVNPPTQPPSSVICASPAGQSAVFICAKADKSTIKHQHGLVSPSNTAIFICFAVIAVLDIMRCKMDLLGDQLSTKLPTEGHPKLRIKVFFGKAAGLFVNCIISFSTTSITGFAMRIDGLRFFPIKRKSCMVSELRMVAFSDGNRNHLD